VEVEALDFRSGKPHRIPHVRVYPRLRPLQHSRGHLEGIPLDAVKQFGPVA
jgi:hypothetical protein